MLLQQQNTSKQLSFLSGGGEMGGLIRSKDWSATSLGTPDTWPQSLRTSLGILLNSKFPMFLFWGKEFTCFYNDAYRPSLGINGKHPGILGQPGEMAWPDIWHIIKPLIDQVMAGEGATWSEDQLIPIYRNGKMEDVYWTFSYSPVIDESGEIAAVFVTCTETTDKVKLVKELKEREDQLNFIIDAAELATWDINTITNDALGNRRMKQWLGIPEEEPLGLATALKMIVKDDRLKVIKAINHALDPKSNGLYEVEYSLISPLGERRVLSKGKAIFDEENVPVRFSGITEDITERKKAAERAIVSDNRFRNTVSQAPVGIVLLIGENFIIENANEFYLRFIDKREEEVTNKPLFKVLPEAKDLVEPLLQDVLKTGIPYSATEFPVMLNRYGETQVSYFNFTYQPFKDDDGHIIGVTAVVMDVTETVHKKQQIEETQRRLQEMVNNSPIPMTILRGRDFIIESANEALLKNFWMKKETEVIGKPIFEVFPELKDQRYAQLLMDVFEVGETHRETEAEGYINRDGNLEKLYMDFEYAPLFDADGNVSGILTTISDITSRVEARRKIEENEKTLGIVIEASELGMWKFDFSDGEPLFSNRHLEIFGVNPGTRITQKELLDKILPEDIPIRDAAHIAAFKSGRLQYEVRIKWPDESIHWIQVKGKVFYDAEGKPHHMIGTTRDISKEKKQQQELEDREKMFRLLADSMPQLVWVGDANGNITYYNQSMYSFTGLSEQELKDNGWLQVVHPEDRAENVRMWEQAVATGRDYVFENRFLTANGDYRWHLSRAIPQKDENGNTLMWVGTSTDIQQIKEQDEQKDLFISMASHELKTPITTVKGYVQILQAMYASSSDEFLQNSLAIIDRQIVTLTKLIADLLDVSKIKSGSLNLNREEFVLNDLVTELVENTKQVSPAYSIALSLQDAVKINADRDRIGQVLINLLSNAIKYSPDTRTISISVTNGDKEITVAVKDSGIGISKNDQSKIFDRFYRAEGNNEKRFSGFGIGLFIAAEIVKKHSGNIWVCSEEGKGSTFYFSIPFGK